MVTKFINVFFISPGSQPPIKYILLKILHYFVSFFKKMSTLFISRSKIFLKCYLSSIYLVNYPKGSSILGFFSFLHKTAGGKLFNKVAVIWDCWWSWGKLKPRFGWYCVMWVQLVVVSLKQKEMQQDSVQRIKAGAGKLTNPCFLLVTLRNREAFVVMTSFPEH